MRAHLNVGKRAALRWGCLAGDGRSCRPQHRPVSGNDSTGVYYDIIAIMLAQPCCITR